MCVCVCVWRGGGGGGGPVEGEGVERGLGALPEEAGRRGLGEHGAPESSQLSGYCELNKSVFQMKIVPTRSLRPDMARQRCSVGLTRPADRL